MGCGGARQRISGSRRRTEPRGRVAPERYPNRDSKPPAPTPADCAGREGPRTAEHEAPGRGRFPSHIMIRFILLQNRQGRTRLAKYYVPFTDAEKHKVEHEVHRMVSNRDQKFTNFVDYQNGKIIYRRYAGLYFSLCVDSTDNELVCLEIIHLFVEILDHYFGNVRELDLVYNFHKVFVITADNARARVENVGHVCKDDDDDDVHFFASSAVERGGRAPTRGNTPVWPSRLQADVPSAAPLPTPRTS